MDSRILLVKGKQRELIEEAKKKSRMTWEAFSREMKVSKTMLRNNLRYERYLMSLSCLKRVCASLENPNCFEKYVLEIRHPNWGKIKGGLAAGALKKFGTPRIKIKEPGKSKELCEFIGILLGDGSVCKTNYSVEIFLNRNSDAEYSKYVKVLFNKLFEIEPHVIHVPDKTLIKLRVNSKALYTFIKNLPHPTDGLEKSIPEWLMGDKKFLTDVVRGIFDTDGSLFMSSRRSILNISSKSSKMIGQVADILNSIGINNYISGTNLNVTSVRGIKIFMSLIGSSNPRNTIKFLEYVENKNTVRSAQIGDLFEKYNSLVTPYFYPPDKTS